MPNRKRKNNRENASETKVHSNQPKYNPNAHAESQLLPNPPKLVQNVTKKKNKSNKVHSHEQAASTDNSSNDSKSAGAQMKIKKKKGGANESLSKSKNSEDSNTVANHQEINGNSIEVKYSDDSSSSAEKERNANPTKLQNELECMSKINKQNVVSKIEHKLSEEDTIKKSNNDYTKPTEIDKDLGSLGQGQKHTKSKRKAQVKSKTSDNLINSVQNEFDVKTNCIVEVNPVELCRIKEKSTTNQSSYVNDAIKKKRDDESVDSANENATELCANSSEGKRSSKTKRNPKNNQRQLEYSQNSIRDEKANRNGTKNKPKQVCTNSESTRQRGEKVDKNRNSAKEPDKNLGSITIQEEKSSSSTDSVHGNSISLDSGNTNLRKNKCKKKKAPRNILQKIDEESKSFTHNIKFDKSDIRSSEDLSSIIQDENDNSKKEQCPSELDVYLESLCQEETGDKRRNSAKRKTKKYTDFTTVDEIENDIETSSKQRLGSASSAKKHKIGKESPTVIDKLEMDLWGILDEQKVSA